VKQFKTKFMRKTTTIILIITVAIGGWLLYDNILRGLIPAFGPGSKNLSDIIRRANEQQSKGEQVEFPLTLPAGMQIGVFADNLNAPRDIEFDPDGTLLVSLPSQGKIVALIDANNDGIAEEERIVIEGLNNPHGFTFHESTLYIAEETSVSRYTYDTTSTTATRDRELFTIPTGGRHSTRTITFDDQNRMFVSIGSSCDTCEENHEFLAAVIIADNAGESQPRLFAAGLRNAVFIKYHKETDRVWATEMGRDNLGDDIPPDEINILSDGEHYGWPYCYGDNVWDSEFGLRDQPFCDTTTAPTWNMQAHSAPLGLTFINSSKFPDEWQGDILVAYHGSWNRSQPTGYKIVRLERDNTTITSEHDFITGWLKGNNALGRPVDLEFDRKGNLFISDDKAGLIYIVTN
jgi:glucose/arabinose dehydrogenase